MREDVLRCIICGFEFSGTTMMSELIRQHPKIDGRFETGLLTATNIKDFKSRGNFVKFVKDFWGISDKNLDKMCKAGSWTEAYNLLLEFSNISDKTVQIYDKTPQYMMTLKGVMSKVDVPCIVTVKDPRAVYWSAKRRRQSKGGTLTVTEFANHYNNYANGYEEAKKIYGNRIMLVQTEELCIDPIGVGKRVYDFLGLEFDEKYVKLPSVYGAHTNIYGNRGKNEEGGIRKDRLFEYNNHVDKSELIRVLNKTRKYAQWHWK